MRTGPDGIVRVISASSIQDLLAKLKVQQPQQQIHIQVHQPQTPTATHQIQVKQQQQPQQILVQQQASQTIVGQEMIVEDQSQTNGEHATPQKGTYGVRLLASAGADPGSDVGEGDELQIFNFAKMNYSRKNEIF